MKENVVFAVGSWYTYPIKTKQHQPKVRRYNMQGSFGDATERFRGGKKKDNAQAKFHKKDNEFRNRRRNRHQDAD